MFHFNKVTSILKPYLLSGILFILAGWVFNTIETFSFCNTQENTSFITILQSFFNITTVFCLYSLLILPVYLLVGILKQKPAQVLAALLFAILFILEIGLYIYYKQTGVLMGSELIVRPFSEILLTIRNSSNLFLNTVLMIIIIALFIVLPILLRKIKILNRFISLISSFIIIGLLSACTLFYQKDENKTINEYLTSKSFHFFCAAIDHFMHEPEPDYLIYEETGNLIKIEKNEKLLQQYRAIFPNRTIPDLDYPLERPASEIPDVLSPYFNKSEKQPNIVIIIVESLANNLLGNPSSPVSFTPFIDSLATTGLYWKNCLSASPRTYAVLPTIVASAPHGMRGFQFGIMPKHHSIFTILKKNDYATHFFYGGETTFDCMLDFLTVQELDHIDHFMLHIRQYKKKKQANWWGVHDQVFFDESLAFLKSSSPQKPRVDLYLTISTHDPFNHPEDVNLKKHYEPLAKKIFLQFNESQKNFFYPVKERIANYIYEDDCLRNFFHNYSKLPEYENTIFIITGDHTGGIHKNELVHHSVPLIIWSPLLKKPETFPNIVSHWDITPSIISFLQHNYDVKTPDYLSWYSDGLDTVSIFNPTAKVLFLSYEREVKTMVYEQYFFEYSGKKLYEIDENLDLKPVNNAKLVENINSKFQTLKYVNNFVYHNDQLVKHADRADVGYKLIKTYQNNETIVCKTPDTIPSIHGKDKFDIMPVQKIKGNYNKIKIKFMADFVINDYLYQNHHMRLNFVCLGKEFEYLSNEYITKYIADETVLCDTTYRLYIEKEVAVNDLNKFSIHIFVSTNEMDEYWQPDKKITISNVKTVILGKE